MNDRALHVAWTAFQRRQVSMSALLDMEVEFLPVANGSRVRKAVSYLACYARTLAMLIRRRPAAVWVQVPQTPALWAALAYRALVRRDAAIIADCHNAAFRRPWSHFPGSRQALQSSDLIVVHNQSVVDQALALALPRDRIAVLEDPPATFDAPDLNDDRPDSSGKPVFLFPASLAADEPIRELVETARMLPQYRFQITGRREKLGRHVHPASLPANVETLGYLSVEEFERALRRADVIMGFTRLEGVQLSVCSEAVGYGKPMLLSDTRILRELFGTAAVFADSSQPASIAAACRSALENKDRLSEASRALFTVRRRKWLEDQALPLLRRRLAGRGAAALVRQDG